VFHLLYRFVQTDGSREVVYTHTHHPASVLGWRRWWGDVRYQDVWFNCL